MWTLLTAFITPFLANEFWLQIIRFVLGSTFVLGSVSLLIRCGLVKQLRLQALLWKTGVVTSLLLLLPLNPLLPSFTFDIFALQTVTQMNGTMSSTAAEPGAVAAPTNLVSIVLARLPDITATALLLWILISGATLWKLLRAHRNAIGALSQRQPVDPFSPLREHFAVQCRHLRIHPLPKLTVSERIASPMTLAQNEICLPRWMIDSMPAEELSCVIAHELGHIRNHDILLTACLQVTSSVFFFQPLFQTARDQLLDLAEFLADQQAVEHNPDVEQIASVLVNCADRVNQQTNPDWGFAMVGNTSRLRSRIEQLLGRGDYATHRVGAPLQFILVLVLLSTILLVPDFNIGNTAFAQPAADNLTIKPVECTRVGYESIVDDVHAQRVTPQDGLASWEEHCGKELGREIDSLWQQNLLPDHHLWYMANSEQADGSALNPVMAALYRAWANKQANKQANRQASNQVNSQTTPDTQQQ